MKKWNLVSFSLYSLSFQLGPTLYFSKFFPFSLLYSHWTKLESDSHWLTDTDQVIGYFNILSLNKKQQIKILLNINLNCVKHWNTSWNKFSYLIIKKKYASFQIRRILQ